MNNNQKKGFCKLSRLQRIGLGAGDLAQNLIYQAVSLYLLFFYTDVYVLGGDAAKSAGLAGILFLAVRLVDVLWTPLIGKFVDKHNPVWGKYRSYLVMGGIPLTILFILCFWDGFKSDIIYACITYLGMALLYTLTSVPFGTLNSSLALNTSENATLTNTRMFMANIGGLCVSAGVPVMVAVLAGKDLPLKMSFFMALGSLPSFIIIPMMPAIKRRVGRKNMFYLFLSAAIIGMATLYIISRMGAVKENIVPVYIAQFVRSTGIIVATVYMWSLIPEAISFGEHTTGRRISGILNTVTGIFFKAGIALGGIISGWVLAGTNYKAAVQSQTMPKDSNAWFLTMFVFAVVCVVLLLFCFSQAKERVAMDKSEKKKNVKTSNLWAEFRRNRQLRIVALFFITVSVMMSVGNAASVYFLNDLELQDPMAQEGIRWLVSVIPAILLVIAMFIISKFELNEA